MSHDTDSFIDEVTEEVRRDRLYAILRKYGWLGLLLIALVVGGAAWREYRVSRDRAAAQSWGDSILAAEKSADPVDALAKVDAAGSDDRAALARLLAAGAAVEANQPEKATPLLDGAVTAVGDDAVLADLVRLKAVLAAGDKMEPSARDAALATLGKPGAPFRLLALEQQAVALAQAGREQDALTLIREILQQDGVSAPLRRRLSEMMIALGAPEAEVMNGLAGLAGAAAPAPDAAPAAPTE